MPIKFLKALYRLSAPGSKSYMNRALIMASLTKGAVTIKNPLYSDDTDAMIECLKELGIKIDVFADQLIVGGDIGDIQEKSYRLFVRDSGTTARFLLAFLCIVPGVKVIEGNKRLNERPISDLVDALRELGAEISYCEREGTLPLKIASSSLSGRYVHVKGDISSQFCSALLLIAPCFSKGLTIFLKSPLISKPYVDMTAQYVREWGVDVTLQPDGSYQIPAGASYQKKEQLIEGDFSSAAYFFAIGALTRSRVRIENLNPVSLQADRTFLKILEKMGNRFVFEESAITIEGNGVRALEVNMQDCPDQVMTVSVLAACAKGVTKISGISSLRYKESNRVFALQTELKKMGIQTEVLRDTLVIYGGSPRPAEIDPHNDHRMAMAFAVLSKHPKGIVIRHPEVVEKTFPAFWKVLEGVK